MKTTIDLPDQLLQRAKIVAAQRNTTVKDLVISGLNLAMRPKIDDAERQAALRRLRKGLDLKPGRFTREQLHERR